MAFAVHETVGVYTVWRALHPHLSLKPQQSGMMYRALLHSGRPSPLHLSLSLSLSLTDRLLLSNWPTLSLSSEHIFTLSHTHPIELTFILSIPPSLTLSCLHCHSHIVGTYRPTHKHKSKGMYQHTHNPFSVTRKDRQMSIKVALKMISLGKLKILTP